MSERTGEASSPTSNSDQTTDSNAIERAIDFMAQAFGSPGKAALRCFLDALPSDATIVWGEDCQWASAHMVAMKLREELRNG